MHVRTRPLTVLALLVVFAGSLIPFAPGARSAEVDELSAFNGEWLYVEDRTEGRAAEDQQPPMSVTFGLRVEEDAVIFVRGKGARQREERIPLDGSTIEVPDSDSMSIYRGEWKDGALEYVTEVYRLSDDEQIVFIRREFRPTADGLLIRVVVGDPAQLDSVAFYRHPEDIPLRTPAKATIADMDWLTGAWTGTRGSSSIEERWSPSKGGAMLAVARTVSSGRMTSFEYLRIVERDGGLVYLAQPGGIPPTEFVLTELDGTRAVFENPRHDSPQRIAYELSDELVLTASIGFIHGGRPTRFVFEPEEF